MCPAPCRGPDLKQLARRVVILADRVRVPSASPGRGKAVRFFDSRVPSVCHTRWIATSAESATAPKDTEFTWHRRTTRPPASTNHALRWIRNQLQNEHIVRLTPEQLKQRMTEKKRRPRHPERR